MISAPSTPLTDIGHLILEDHPYILPFEILKYSSDGKLTAKLPNNQVYYNANFAELLQVISTLGSYCVALQRSGSDRMAYLADKLRIRKINFSRLDERGLVVSAVPVLHTKRSAKAVITIAAETDILYSYEIDYIIFTQSAFQKVFQPFYQATAPSALPPGPLPASALRALGPDHFTVSISPFGVGHCKGHFEAYPIVPVVFILDHLIRRIGEWLGGNYPDAGKMIIDHVEVFANKAIPVDTRLTAPVVVRKVSAKAALFMGSLQNEEGQELGFYFITIEYK